ncbi:MAG: hypothetical protein COV76_05440 [Candidatus Omnitrophica bacterium CG11_big_fil_rev_8_21_14_0_20_64_10]|nr:MAG: hypothetical protein COV76_05440 [Candidatus Omnitrophica bacterium CG11_big_fil_rev_8_21_14_0_20_64_10]
MNWPTVLGTAAVFLLLVVLFFLWRMVRMPLPVEMQEALERKTEAKLGTLKEEWSRRLSEEIQRTWAQLQGQVQTTESAVSRKLEEANRTYAQVMGELGQLRKAAEQVEQVGRHVASLQELLRAPKLRGGLGEYFLEDLLRQILPAAFYTTQHAFSSGEIVDAVVRLQGRLVPIDSKFPLEQFRKMGEAATEAERAAASKALRRDVKGHIDAIAEKYIRPEEGTFDFALMYIPAENVYYETVIRSDEGGPAHEVFQHAVQKHVIPVSPNSFYAYLQVIVMGLRGLDVEIKAKEIVAGLMKLQKDLIAVREDFDLTGKQLRHAVANFEKADKRLSRFEDRLEQVEAAPASDAVLPPSTGGNT